MSARDAILASIRSSLGDAARKADLAVPPVAPARWVPGDVDLFCERVADYRATVHRVGAAELPALVARLLATGGIRSLLVPDGLDPHWLSEAGRDVRQVRDSALTADELDQVDGVITGSRTSIAETGTIVLDHTAGLGRRALSLVPDYHLCVVVASSIANDVPAAVGALDPQQPLTFISGPSATSDIELSRVEGVHGPRRLEVVVVET